MDEINSEQLNDITEPASNETNAESETELNTEPINGVNPESIFSVDSDVEEDIPSSIDLPLGKSLSIDDTYPITAKEDSKLIVLAGPSGCGKTTLVTSMYQAFLKHPNGNLIFAGSQTLVGFEERAAFTRVSSNLAEPTTMKTRSGITDDVLHLRLKDIRSGKVKNILLSDFSGEDFQSAVANVEIMKQDFSVIKNAKILVIILDGDLLSNKKLRHGTLSQAKSLLKTIIDAELLDQKTRIYYVITKYDIVLDRKSQDKTISDFIDSIDEKVEKDLEDLVDRIVHRKVIALPISIKDASEYNVLNLLFEWFEYKDDIITVTSDESEMTSEMNKFGLKYFGGR